MANIPVSSEINTLLTSTTLNASTTALSALGAGYPTLFSSTAPVNGRAGYLNTSVLRADDGTIVTAPILFADTSNTGWYSDGYITSDGETGWSLGTNGSDWDLYYWESYAPVGGWHGVGAGADPASSTIVWNPVPTSLGIPLFTSVQPSGATVGKLGQVLHSTIANNVFRYECISEFPYTWQLDSTVTVSSTTPTNPILGMEWFEETSTQSIFYTGASWIGTNYNSQAQKDGYTIALAAHMTEQVDSRLAGKDAATDMRLFTGLGSNTTATVFPQNTTCWLHSLRSQLCGFHMGAGAGYGQGYGLLPLGGRFFLGVAHNGPAAGATVYYPLPDGTTFTTTIQRIFLDNATTGVSLTGVSPDTVASGARRAYDFSIYITAAAAPSTLSVIPLVNLDINLSLMTVLNPPTVYISQGSSTSTAAKAPTPQNRKCAVMPFTNGYYSADTFALRSSFGHQVSVGDSGCPQYLLINNKLYLQEMNTLGYAPISTGNGFNYIQDLVNRAAAAHGISPITITTVKNPPLS